MGTGAIATAFSQANNQISVDSATITTANTDSLKSGSRLYTFNQPFSSTAAHAAGVLLLDVALDGSLLYFDANSREAIYRRTDDPDNQNFYGSDDTGAISADGFCTTRGSANIYPCAADGVTASFSASTDNTINSNAALTTSFAGIWTGVQGPFKAIGAVANAAIVEDTGGSGINQANFGDTVDAAGVGAGKLNGHKITLTETFSGQHLLKLCDACVDSNAVTGKVGVILLNAGSPMNIPVNQGLLLGS